MSPRVNHLENDQCRQCTSFADYMKENRRNFEKGAAEQDMCMPEEAPKGPRRDDCPLDKDDLGSKSWGLLHTIAAKYPAKPTEENKKDICTFFTSFSKLYPCDHCAADLRDDLKSHPPKTSSQQELSTWLCQLHNRVNVKIGKPKFDCNKVNERWRDGWLDGSCDS